MIPAGSNSIPGNFAGASLGGKQSPGTPRHLWELKSYGCFVRCWSARIQRMQVNPAPSAQQTPRLAMFAQQGISAFIGARHRLNQKHLVVAIRFNRMLRYLASLQRRQ